jgi:hypothetical protein|tara:strand:- start:452 stop:667 length:216 start_codon:yes stop_codon:yes gene_type:complete
VKAGDLVYIPQDASFWDVPEGGSLAMEKTKKPTSAIFLREVAEKYYRVYIRGREATVFKKQVYPMEKQNAS